MKVNIKKLDEKAVIPSYAKQGDAGMDLTAVSLTIDEYGNHEYGCGLAIEIPEGFEGQIRPRSSIKKYDLTLCNTPGTVDSGYRGEIKVVFRPAPAADRSPVVYNVGERIAQIVIKPVPFIQFVETEELSASERGEGGYGSTGK